MKTYKEFVTEMVAGDAGGSPQNIASGTTSGDIVNKGPETLPKKRKADTDAAKKK
ncbi:hypothetical protein RCIP0102_00126 [Klebsiella phage RCIP0102]|uniref:Major capsid protein n=1 Tax=Klebsiella phage RCIP0102 TaxID=3094270 RepID=A0AAX4H010_9VIRU